MRACMCACVCPLTPQMFPHVCSKVVWAKLIRWLLAAHICKTTLCARTVLIHARTHTPMQTYLYTGGCAGQPQCGPSQHGFLMDQTVNLTTAGRGGSQGGNAIVDIRFALAQFRVIGNSMLYFHTRTHAYMQVRTCAGKGRRMRTILQLPSNVCCRALVCALFFRVSVRIWSISGGQTGLFCGMSRKDGTTLSV